MKVLHLISGGDTGGAKTSLYTLLTELKKIMTVRLVCFMDGDFAEGAKALGIDVVVLPQKRRFDMSVVKVLHEMCEKEHFDLVNCHGARANFIGMFLKRKVRIPMITTIHSDFMHDFDNSLYKKIVFTTLNRYSLKKMDAYIAVSKMTKDDFVRHGFDEKKTYLCYNGIPVDKKEASQKELEDFGAKYGLTRDKNEYYVGTAARLHPIKGIDVFLRAAQIVHNEYPYMKFLIAGDGEERYAKKYKDFVIQNNLQDAIFFLGYVKEINLFYQWIDINTLASHSEGLCYAILEGGKYEKPTIASMVGGIPEIITDRVDGLLFDNGADDQLAEKIRFLYEVPGEAIRLGKALRKTVETKFSDQAMAKSYEETYKNILERYANEKEKV